MNKIMLKNLKINHKWFLAGIILLILGYIILSISPLNQPYEKTVFALHKLTLAPIILAAGYFSVGFSILKPTKK